MKILTDATPRACDFCGKPAKYDAPTTMGPWGNLCAADFRRYASAMALTAGYVLGKPPRSFKTDKQSVTVRTRFGL